MGIFEPFIAIGYTTTSVPFSVQRLGTEAFVTVSVGRAFQIYNVIFTGFLLLTVNFQFWMMTITLILSIVAVRNESSPVLVGCLDQVVWLCELCLLSFLKMWIFDTSDGDARLLQFRSGHSDPPQYMRELVEFLFLN
ncbi:uncharacterized protein LOC133712445 isoform X2 [Rosa rugosa]|uniref:uncharacterized protein LOC133712445 isoform X2 n=1 Tax=Rosa rugosa TaxID=74645 RepID=UPI002B40B3C5|nr:uncharacterized protein LOC133712445 isoform X2 [Rosa rugosa]